MWKVLGVIAIALIWPAVVGAFAIQSVQHSASHSGGLSVGTQVRSTGDSSATARVQTKLIGGDSGSVQVELITESDGAESNSRFDYDIEGGHDVAVRISTSSKHMDARIDVRARDTSRFNGSNTLNGLLNLVMSRSATTTGTQGSSRAPLDDTAPARTNGWSGMYGLIRLLFRGF